ncbi:MAG TPA: phage tail protein [Opitutales bacterium]|nr:phage tail protein [Opitutales bacterium]
MSGELDITPGFQISGDGNTPVTVGMLNQLVQGILARVAKAAITARELADGSISLDKLSADISAQLSAGLADGSVTANKLAVNAVATAKLQDGAVTLAKLDSGQGWLPAMYVIYPGTTLAGFLRCEGQAVSRTTYAALFAVLGTTFGAGDGTTTFNLPDARGGVPYIAGDPGVTDVLAKTLGQVLGPDKHTHAMTGNVGDTALTQAQLPAVLTGLTFNFDNGSGNGGFAPERLQVGNSGTVSASGTGSLANPGGGQTHNHGPGTLASDKQAHTPRGVVLGYLFVKT